VRPKNLWDPSTVSAFNSLFQDAATKGVTICVASGDNGSSDGEEGNNVDFPASSPWVLACGGTRLTCPTKVYSQPSTSEIVWGTIPNNGASGGGFSSIFPRPAYQILAAHNYSQTGRGVPDISLNADPMTGWIIYINSALQVIGGTSAVSPFWAAYLASIGYHQFLNTKLYAVYQSTPNIVHDIVVGNDGGYSAGPKWDPVSGLGSLNGSVLTPILSNGC